MTQETPLTQNETPLRKWIWDNFFDRPTATGYVGSGDLVHSLQMRLASDRKLYYKPRKYLILMWKCSSCLKITTSYITGTRSKNGMLGGDKYKFFTIIWGGQAPSPDPTPFKQTAHLVNNWELTAKHWFLVSSHFSNFWPFSVADFSAAIDLSILTIEMWYSM